MQLIKLAPPSSTESFRINQVASTANKSLEALRVTYEMVRAAELQKEAQQELLVKQQELIKVGYLVGYDGAAIKHSNRVQVNNGEMQIFDIDAPEVTEVYHADPAQWEGVKIGSMTGESN